MGELGSTCSYSITFLTRNVICVQKKYVNKVTVYHSLNIQMRFDAYEIAKGSVVHAVLRHFKNVVCVIGISKTLLLKSYYHIKHPCL